MRSQKNWGGGTKLLDNCFALNDNSVLYKPPTESYDSIMSSSVRIKCALIVPQGNDFSLTLTARGGSSYTVSYLKDGVYSTRTTSSNTTLSSSQGDFYYIHVSAGDLSLAYTAL